MKILRRSSETEDCNCVASFSLARPRPHSATQIGTREDDDWSGIRSSGTEEREGEGDGDLEVVARNALESPEY